MRRVLAACILVGVWSLGAPVEASPCPDSPSPAQAAKLYPWPRRRARYESLCRRIPAPSGFQRVATSKGSYAYWLRHLPLLPAGSPVLTYDGRVAMPAGSPWVAAVVDLDVGRRNWQQCWDSIIRLRAEYLWQAGKAGRVAFPYARGVPYLRWRDWARGFRPVKRGRRYVLERKARSSYSRANFRRYLNHLFVWTGTVHAARTPSVPLAQIRAGDFFVWMGSPGHAVLVLDVVRSSSGRVAVLLGEGFMPAQDFHVLASSGPTHPWYLLDSAETGIQTPWGLMTWDTLHRFRH